MIRLIDIPVDYHRIKKNFPEVVEALGKTCFQTSESFDDFWDAFAATAPMRLSLAEVRKRFEFIEGACFCYAYDQLIQAEPVANRKRYFFYWNYALITAVMLLGFYANSPESRELIEESKELSKKIKKQLEPV